MDIFNVLTMIGGLALFLYGMHVMGDGLAKTSGGKLEVILEKFTSKDFICRIAGCRSDCCNPVVICDNSHGRRFC